MWIFNHFKVFNVIERAYTNKLGLYYVLFVINAILMLNASTCFKLIEGDKKYTHHITKDVVLQRPEDTDSRQTTYSVLCR